jgi:hypothetical protein
MRRFSKHELFRLRNSIDINTLISETLKIPSKTSQAYLRFLCPICLYYDTATKRETNLARCFRCERNFNTIEIVMAARHLNFTESVRYLQSLLPENHRKEVTRHNHPPSPQAQTEAVIDTITENIGVGRAKKTDKNSENDLVGINQQKTATDELNVRVNQLSKQLRQLKSFVVHQFVGRSNNQ